MQIISMFLSFCVVEGGNNGAALAKMLIMLLAPYPAKSANNSKALEAVWKL
jgi:hypothetical protein